LGWYHHGQLPVDGTPFISTAKQGIEHRNPEDSEPTLQCDQCEISWKEDNSKDGYYPYVMNMGGLKEWYEDGELSNRIINSMSMTWRKDIKHVIHNDAYDDLIREQYPHLVSLWDGDFYKDSGTKFALTADLLRLKEE